MKAKSPFKRPTLMWTALALLLLLAALLVPQSWTKPVSNFFGEPESTIDPYVESVERVDRALANGRAVDLSRAKLERMLPYIQARRRTRAGPMSAGEVREAVDILQEFDRKIDLQKLEGSREALRAERNRRLAKAFPRLNADKIAQELETLRGQVQSVD